MHGNLSACVNGVYDFVDVCDVAFGCLQSVERGRIDECYILSNRHYEIKQLLKLLRKIHGGKRVIVLPTWLAKIAAPVIQWYCKLKKQRPLYTNYSLYFNTDGKFSHDKAT